MSPRRAIFQGLAVIALLVFGFGLWAALARIEGAIVLSALVEPKGGRLLIQHPHGGRLVKIHFAEGAEVEAGAIIAEIDSSEIAVELAALGAELAAARARESRLKAELAGQSPSLDDLLQQGLHDSYEAISAEEGRIFGRQIAQIEENLRGIEAQSAALARQRKLIAQERLTQEELQARGLAQIGPLLALQREEARLTGQEGELAAARLATEAKRAEIAHQQQRAMAQRRERLLQELQDLARHITELQLRQEILDQRFNARFIRAPVAGYILGLRARGHLEAGEILCELLPKAAELVAFAEVPPQIVSEIATGQSVRLMIAAPNAKALPPLYGRLRAISPDLYQPREGRPHFRAEITLPDPPWPVLRSGLRIEAYVLLPERSPLLWLMQPIMDYFRPALRES